MARKRYVTVTDYPPRKKGKLYKMRVQKIEASTKMMSAVLEDLERNHKGRTCNLPNMPLPHPGNMTSLLLAACGANANQLGERICLDDLVGTHIGAKFNKAGEPVEFVRLKPAAPEPTAPANTMEPNHESQLSESF